MSDEAARLFGSELRRARERAGLSLAGLCQRYRAAGRAYNRGWLANVEKGLRLPENRDLAEVSDDVFGTDGLLGRLWDFAQAAREDAQEHARATRLAVTEIAAKTLSPLASGDVVHVPYITAPGTVAYMKMSRRAFLAGGGMAAAGLATTRMSTGERVTADTIATDILAGDPCHVSGSITSHALDLTIAAQISARGLRPTPLAGWMSADDPALAVNATGIAAKMIDHDLIGAAISSLGADDRVRQRYLACVFARIYPIRWDAAEDWATDRHLRARVTDLTPLTDQLSYAEDAGARWCAGFVLADVWADPDHAGAPAAAQALEQALADEPIPELRTAYGRALARRPLAG